jgi:hypothetical protein
MNWNGFTRSDYKCSQEYDSIHNTKVTFPCLQQNILLQCAATLLQTLPYITSLLMHYIIQTYHVQFCLYKFVRSILNMLSKIQISNTILLLCRQSLWSSFSLIANAGSKFNHTFIENGQMVFLSSSFF